jgi:lysophospholipase L1-like esterase
MSGFPKTPGRRLTLRRKLVFALFAWVILFAGIEVAARCLHGVRAPWVDMHRYHPVLGWCLREGWSGDRPWCAGFARVDACGIRSDAVIQRKQAGEKRLLALGDSVTFGARVPTSAAWPAQLESCLHEAGVHWNVLNCGVSGYDPSQEVDWLTLFGWDLEPDAIAIGFCRNDVQLSDRTSSLAHQRLDAVSSWLTEHSLVAFQVEQAVRHLQRRLGLLSATLPITEGQEPAGALSGWPLVEQSYRRLDRLARARNLPVILVVFPKLPLINGKPFDDFSDRLQVLGKELGWTVIDLVDAFAPDSDELFFPEDAIHPNEAGHERAGRAIAREVIRSEALKRRAAK